MRPSLPALPPPRRIALVACARTKLACAASARELYASPLFRLVRAYVERTCDGWHVLSAKHGLLDPDDVLRRYDLTLAQLTPAQRAAWGERVCSRLGATHGAGTHFVVYAGTAYRRHLVPHLEAGGCTVSAPLAGLTIGRQLAWLRRALEQTAPILLP